MITGMNHITLTVKDIEISFYFYKDVLGLKPLCRWDKGAYFLAGDFWFCLNVDINRKPTNCYTHYAFCVSRKDFNALSQNIEKSGSYIFKENISPGDSLYFLDPDGHKIEIHTENWKNRIAAKKETPGSWKNIEWFV